MSIINVSQNSAPLDNKQRRIFRLAFGVTACSALAIGFGWPLSYLAPMLVASILGGSDMSLGPKKSLAMLVVIFLGLFSGVLFSSLFMGSPVLASLLLSILFYWIYYFSNRGLLPNFAGMMLIIGMTAMPLMAQIDPVLGARFSEGFLNATVVALIFAGLSYYFFPHSPEVGAAEADKAAGKVRVAPTVCALPVSVPW